MKDLMIYLNKKYHLSNNKFIYIGHNEHISLNCNDTIKDKEYLTDGYYLKNICNIKYLSISTYSNELYTVRHCKIKLIKGKNKRIWNTLFKENENYKIISNKDNLILKMENYTNRDFDYVICIKKIIPLTLLNKMLKE